MFSVMMTKLEWQIRRGKVQALQSTTISKKDNKSNVVPLVSTGSTETAASTTNRIKILLSASPAVSSAASSVPRNLLPASEMSSSTSVTPSSGGESKDEVLLDPRVLTGKTVSWTSELKESKKQSLPIINSSEVTTMVIAGPPGSFASFQTGNYRGCIVGIKIYSWFSYDNPPLHLKRPDDDPTFEAKILMDLNHHAKTNPTLRPYIVNCYGVMRYKHPEINALVMEYAEGLELADWMDNNRGKKQYIDQGLQIAENIALGLAEFQAIGFLHRDLKIENIKVDSNLKPKFLDYATGCWITPNSDAYYDACNFKIGTVSYRAPEVIKRRKFSFSSEVYAFGTIVFIIREGKDTGLFYNHLPENEDYLYGKSPQIPAYWEPSLISLIKTCWNADSTRRPNIKQIAHDISNIRLGLKK